MLVGLERDSQDGPLFPRNFRVLELGNRTSPAYFDTVDETKRGGISNTIDQNFGYYQDAYLNGAELISLHGNWEFKTRVSGEYLVSDDSQILTGEGGETRRVHSYCYFFKRVGP